MVNGVDENGVEVVVAWGSYVLDVRQLWDRMSFTVGDDESVDFVLGETALGLALLPILVDDHGGCVVVPCEATLDVIPHPTQERTSRAPSWIPPEPPIAEPPMPYHGLPGAVLRKRATNATMVLHYRGFTFVIRSIEGRDRLAASTTFRIWDYRHTALSVLLHLCFLVLVYFTPPSSSALSMIELEREPLRLMRYRTQPSEVNTLPAIGGGSAVTSQSAGGTMGREVPGDVGAMGEPNKPNQNRKSASVGPKHNPRVPPNTDTLAAAKDARTAGILGVLRGTRLLASAVYTPQTVIGSDDIQALGNVLGSQLGESGGAGGLGMRGAGSGSRGSIDGLIPISSRLNRIGDFGPGGPGGPDGSAAPFSGLRDRGLRGPRTPRAEVSTVGALSKEVIRRVIRAHLSEVRFCYERGLQQQPDLEGRVVVRFIIGPTGEVQSAVVSEHGLSGSAQSTVEPCITSALRRWTFPTPEDGGIVSVSYPFMFSATK